MLVNRLGISSDAVIFVSNGKEALDFIQNNLQKVLDNKGNNKDVTLARNVK